ARNTATGYLSDSIMTSAPARTRASTEAKSLAASVSEIWITGISKGINWYGLSRILLIGATGFIGPHLVRELAQQGHEITIFHRGRASAALPAGVKHLLGDRNDIASHVHDFRRLAPEVVIDLILSSERQAKALVSTFRGLTQRIVALSSGDVYRACGISHGFESGPLQPVPLTEDSELRTARNTYGPELLQQL